MDEKSFNASQVHLHKSQGNEESIHSQGNQREISSISNCEIINSDSGQQQPTQLQSLNIYNVQQKFFNVDEHNQLQNQMKKNPSEEGVPQMESMIFSASKIKQKRGSLQLLAGQENSIFSVQAPMTQKRNSIRKQPSEVLSILSNQNLNFYNNNLKNDSNLSSEFLNSQLMSMNQGRVTRQPSQQSFQNEKRQSKRESIMLNSNTSSINNNVLTVNTNINNNNNNQIISLQNNQSNIANSNISNNILNIKQDSNQANNGGNSSIKDLTNNIFVNTSFSNLKPNSNTNSALSVKKMAQMLQIQYEKEQTVSQIKKLNTLQSKKLMIQQEQEIKQRIVSNMIGNSKTQQSHNRLTNCNGICGRISVGYSSQTVIEGGAKRPHSCSDSYQITSRIRQVINDFASPEEKIGYKGKTFIQNIFRMAVMVISMKIFCLFKKVQKKRALSALGKVNFTFQLSSLFLNIFIIQYFLLKVFKTMEGSLMNSGALDILCMVIGQIEVIFTFLFAQYDQEEMKVIYDQRAIHTKTFSRFSKSIILILDLICFFSIIFEIIWTYTRFPIHSAIINIIRSFLILKLVRIMNSLAALHCHFFKRQLYYQYEIFRILIISTILILTFTNLWCALASYYFQVANFQDFGVLQKANISNDDYNHQFLFFLNKVIENTFSVYTTLESDDQHFEQTFLISLQHIFIGVFYIYMFQSFFTLSKTICELNRKKRQSQIDLIEYSKRINLDDNLLDQSILYISNLPENPNKYSFVTTHREALKILPRSFKNQIQDNFEELLFDRIPFLQQFETSLKKKIYSYVEEITYHPDEQIITEGIIDDCSLYFIVDGEAKVFYSKKTDPPISHTIKTLKKLDYFGEISFLTGEPRKACVKSIGYLTVIKISRRTLITLIKDHILDYQAYCMMRDKIMNGQNYSYINLKCFICEQDTHLASTCPFVHYQMDLVSYVKKYYLDSKDQVRSIYKRRKRATIKAVMCLKKIQRAVSGILEDTFIQGILSEDYSSELQLDEDELDKKIYYDSILLSLEFSEQDKDNNLNNNLGKRPPSQIHVPNLPMTPDRRTSSKLNAKNGSMVASVEDDMDQGFNSNVNNDIVFSSSSINNKILLRSKTNPKDEKNSPKHKPSKGKSVSIQKADSLTNHGGSRYSRSHFHQPVTLSSISHKSSKEKDEIPFFLSRDDLSEKVFNFAAYYPDSNAKTIIDTMNKNHKINSINDLIIKQGSVCSQNFDISNQISILPNQIIGQQYQQQLSFYSVPNYGQTIQNYQQVQRDHQEKAHRKLIDQFNQNFFSNLDNNEDYFFS